MVTLRETKYETKYNSKCVCMCLRFVFNYVCIYASVCGYVHVSADAYRVQKRAPLELELKVVVSYLTQVLGIELRSLVRTGSALNL